MKKWLIFSLICNVILSICLIYILNLKYYDNYYDKNGILHNEEEKIIDLVNRIIIEQGGFLTNYVDNFNC